MHTGWDDEQQRKIDTTDELTAENERLQAEVHELFKRNQVLQSQNDKLQQRKQDAVDEAYKLRQIMRKKERYAIDVKIEFDETLQTERAHVAKLQSASTKLRAQLAEAVHVLNAMHTEMAIVCNAGFDPERWAERMSALNKAGDVLSKHLELIA